MNTVLSLDDNIFYEPAIKEGEVTLSDMFHILVSNYISRNLMSSLI